MNVQRIQYFLDIVQEASLVKAARKNRITQPALSMALQKLEKELGAKLLTRAKNRYQTTAAGEVLFRKGRLLIQEFESIRDEIGDLAGAPRNDFRLVAGGTAAHFIIPTILRNYRALYPQVHFSLVEGDSVEIFSSLTSADCDLALLSLTGHIEPQGREAIDIEYGGAGADFLRQFTVEPFFDDELVVVAPEGRFSSEAVIQPEELSEIDFLHFNANAAIRKMADTFFEAATISVNTVMQLRSISLVKQMVSDGVGVSLLSKLAVSDSDTGLTTYKLAGFDIKRTLALAYPKEKYIAGPLQGLIEDLKEFD